MTNSINISDDLIANFAAGMARHGISVSVSAHPTGDIQIEPDKDPEFAEVEEPARPFADISLSLSHQRATAYRAGSQFAGVEPGDYVAIVAVNGCDILNVVWEVQSLLGERYTGVLGKTFTTPHTMTRTIRVAQLAELLNERGEQVAVIRARVRRDDGAEMVTEQWLEFDFQPWLISVQGVSESTVLQGEERVGAPEPKFELNQEVAVQFGRAHESGMIVAVSRDVYEGLRYRVMGSKLCGAAYDEWYPESQLKLLHGAEKGQVDDFHVRV